MPLLEVPSWVSGGFSLANNGETPGVPGPPGPPGKDGSPGKAGDMGPPGPTGLLQVGPWIDIVPGAGFAVSSPKPQYRKFGDAVQFRGQVMNTTLLALGAARVLCTMPVGFRPLYLAAGENMRSPVMNAVANTLCYVSVTPVGVVSVASVAALGINDRVDLSGFLFQTS